MKRFNSFLIVFSWILMLGCSPEVPSNKLNPQVAKKVFDLTESFNPQVDILFVVDDSGSMDVHQRLFADNVDQFTKSLINQNLNYHLGVISSSDYENGKLHGSPTVIDNVTPDGLSRFASNIMLGTNGDPTEKFFTPIVMALSQGNLNGANRDFLRADSFLVIVLITDAEDQSLLDSAKSTFDFLVKLKGNKKYLMSYGVIIPTTYTQDCNRDDGTPPRRIEEFLGKFQNAPNNIMGLCDTNYGDQLANFSKDIANVVGSTIFLNRLPIPSTITVTYGDSVIMPDFKKGWSYNSEKNAVILGPEIDFTTQPVGTKVNVSYDPIK